MEQRRLNQSEAELPAIGMGTWNLAPPDTYAPAYPDRKKIVAALRMGIDLWLTHVDTAESYGDGDSERMVGEAIKGVRDRVFIATKVEPAHYGYEDVLRAAADSCRRLGTDRIDLYQLHWPSYRVPVRETMNAMEHLVDQGTIRFIGVSNFSAGELREAQAVMSKYRIVSNQVKYNILAREIETRLLPFAVREGITIIAYSPFETGDIFSRASSSLDRLKEMAAEVQKTVAQVCLNWLISKEGVITIPKAIQDDHLRENAGASGWRLPKDSLERISA